MMRFALKDEDNLQKTDSRSLSPAVDTRGLAPFNMLHYLSGLYNTDPSEGQERQPGHWQPGLQESMLETQHKQSNRDWGRLGGGGEGGQGTASTQGTELTPPRLGLFRQARATCEERWGSSCSPGRCERSREGAGIISSMLIPAFQSHKPQQVCSKELLAFIFCNLFSALK